MYTAAGDFFYNALMVLAIEKIAVGLLQFHYDFISFINKYILESMFVVKDWNCMMSTMYYYQLICAEQNNYRYLKKKLM